MALFLLNLLPSKRNLVHFQPYQTITIKVFQRRKDYQSYPTKNRMTNLRVLRIKKERCIKTIPYQEVFMTVTLSCDRKHDPNRISARNCWMYCTEFAKVKSPTKNYLSCQPICFLCV